jgi:hypothetical protein
LLKALNVLYVSVYYSSYNLTINNIFKVPEVPKKPEEKVPVPSPKKEKAPPTKGTSLYNPSVESCSSLPT